MYTLVGCLYPINVKTAEPIGPKFWLDIAWPQGRFMDDIVFKYLPLTKFDFWKFWKSTNFYKIPKILCFFCFTVYTKRKLFTIEKKMGAKYLKSLVYTNWSSRTLSFIVKGLRLKRDCYRKLKWPLCVDWGVWLTTVLCKTLSDQELSTEPALSIIMLKQWSWSSSTLGGW